MKSEELLLKVKELPQKTGVYIFKDNSGIILYVGKALNLKKRVSSYFKKPDLTRPYINKMLSLIFSVDYLIVNCEVEALIAETNLIKRYRPKFNIKMKDDKNYLFLKITKEDFPRVFVARKILKDQSTYFGPYTNASQVKETLEVLKKIFSFRVCRDTLPKKKIKPCLQFHIKRCFAPCVGFISKEEYQKTIAGVKLFLNGRSNILLKRLEKEMEDEAKKKNFEKAALLRDKIKAAHIVLQKQYVVTLKKNDADVFSVAGQKNISAISLFQIRAGKLIGKENFILDVGNTQNLKEVILAFLKQYYSDTVFLPKEILLPIDFRQDELDVIINWLGKKAGFKVCIRAPKRGKFRQIMKMAEINAKDYLEKQNLGFARESKRIAVALKQLSESLGEKKVERIECYDISNIQGKEAVGSMVVFESGIAKKSEYRKFKIKTVTGINDYLMIKEVLMRRFQAHQNKISNFSKLPDLVLIDGGKGHLSVAAEVFDNLRLNIGLASLAKKEEKLFFFNANKKIHAVLLPKNSQGLYLLQTIRDEAHRFAVSYHRLLRGKQQTRSLLDDVSGIGPKTKKVLLEHFKTLDKIKEAKKEELVKVIGEVKANLIKDL